MNEQSNESQRKLNERINKTIGDLVVQVNVQQVQIEELQEELTKLRIKLGEVNQLEQLAKDK